MTDHEEDNHLTNFDEMIEQTIEQANNPPPTPVFDLLSDPNKWDRERDCSTNKNRLTSPDSELAIRWSVRAAVERFYPEDWKQRMRQFMEVAAKHYPQYDRYDHLHAVLSHEAMLYLVKEAKL